MSYLVLARKYRPQDFDSLIGQEFVSTALKNAIALNRVSHSYLFTGARGVGKTSAARILAKALNCLNPKGSNPCNECENCKSVTDGTAIDVLEIDGASNRGIDEIRQLREAVKFLPVKFKYKVYIVDEVHMLTSDASNALLKTLEEPPGYVVFIFATTDAHKMLPTILSRCQRYDFKKIGFEDMKSALSRIYDAEGVKYDADALSLVARYSEGCMRDALSFSDQAISYTSGNITYDSVASMLGVNNDPVINELYKAVLSEDVSKLDDYISALSDKGVSFLYAAEKMITHTRSLLLLKNGASQLKKELTEEELSFYGGIKNVSENRLFALFQLFAKLHSELKYSSFVRYSFEFGVYKAASLSKVVPLPAENIIPVEKKTELLEKPSIKTAENGDSSSNTNQGAPKTTGLSSKTREESFSNTEMLWHNLLTKLKQHEAGLASSLFHSKLDIKNNVYTLSFAKERAFSCKRASSPDNVKKLESFLSKELQKPIRVEIIFDDGGADKSLAVKKEELESVYEKKIREDFAENPVVKEFLAETGINKDDLKVIKN